MDDTITRTNTIDKNCHFSNMKLALEVRALLSPFADQKTSTLQTGKECEYEELHFRRGSSLACGVMGIACSHSLLNLEGCATRKGVESKVWGFWHCQGLYI